MTPLEAIRNRISPELDRLNKHISDSLRSDNELMNRVIDGYLESKGKQIRPVLVLLSARLFAGAVTDRAIRAAASVEMLHNASLIHDDVVDCSDKRRGLPTINNVWDNHIAVLVGDFFVSSSLKEAITTCDLRIVGALASLGRELSVGEMDQIYNARFHHLTEEGYFTVIARKTASLFVACVEMGAYAVGVADDDPRLDALRDFTRRLGLCFQIKDDIFDYFDEGRVGKPTGNDLREGKVTLPLLYALTASSHPRREEMAELARHEELTADEIATLIAFAKEAGGIDYAYATMERLRNEASALTAAIGNNREAEALLSLLDFIITRDN
ncbi:MAG: polyprenyl synthetase family protein [Bacteroidales bacterium]|nr:polyprenyl synthetase family protein [Bacteroidales bacterium]